MTDPAPPSSDSKTSDCLDVVQYATSNDSLAPLVLLHDGGGTIYSYHALGPLHRNVYGISNPKFDAEHQWEGGIPEMANTYANMIRDNVPKGEILLGGRYRYSYSNCISLTLRLGWSFGGLLAIELSKIFDEDDDFSVVGIVLIDTPYPKESEGYALKGVNIMPDMPGVRPRVRTKIHKSLYKARDMAAQWQLPTWTEGNESESSSASASSVPSLASSTSSDSVRSESSMSSVSSSDEGPAKKGLPPAVLLRASGQVDHTGKPQAQRRASATPLVDRFREDPTLGWKEYDKDFIQVVWDIPGDHFSIFSEPFVSITSSVTPDDTSC